MRYPVLELGRLLLRQNAPASFDCLVQAASIHEDSSQNRDESAMHNITTPHISRVHARSNAFTLLNATHKVTQVSWVTRSSLMIH